VEKHGYKPSIKSSNQDEKRLARWAATQRSAKKKSALDSDRLAKLIKVGVVK